MCERVIIYVVMTLPLFNTRTEGKKAKGNLFYIDIKRKVLCLYM